MPTVNQIRSAKRKLKPTIQAATKIQSAWRSKKLRNTGNNLRKLLNGNRACVPKKHLQTVRPLSKGAYGAVFKASLNRNGKRYIAYKKIPMKNDNVYEGMAKYEYNVAKRLKSYGIKVPNVYLAKKCDGREMLYMEYISGKTFADWIRDMPTLEQVKSVILQVVLFLYKMHKLVPGFRHHDLHSGNIFIRKVPVRDIRVSVDGGKTYKRSNEGLEPVILDFGMTKIPGLPNPWINNGTYAEYGMNRKRTHPLFDLYFFLIGVVFDTTTKYKKVQDFIMDLIPDQEYRKQNSKYAVNFRLKIGMKHNKYLPSLKNVLEHPFLSKKVEPFRPRFRITPSTPRHPLQSPKPVNKKSPLKSMRRMGFR